MNDKTLLAARFQPAPDPLPALGQLRVTRCPDPMQVGRTFPLRGEETGIGRNAGNTIAIGDPEMSGQHARIVVREGHLLLVDRRSTNGTYVNGTRLRENAPHRLCVGDTLLLGATGFVFAGS